MSTATTQPATSLVSVAERFGELTRRADDAILAGLRGLQPLLDGGCRLWHAFDRGFGVEQVHFEQLSGEEQPCRASGWLQPCLTLTDDQLLVWKCLDGRSQTAKELAIEILQDPTKDDAIRKRIERMRKLGVEISQVRGRGYYRPDASPSGWRHVDGTDKPVLE